MVDFVLLVTGIGAAAVGTWRGYLVSREAIGPFLHDGDPTRTLIEAGRPLHARPRVRLLAHRVIVAIAWLAVALYGLFLVSVALA